MSDYQVNEITKALLIPNQQGFLLIITLVLVKRPQVEVLLSEMFQLKDMQ